MSFELFLCSYQDGEPAGIPEDRLRQAFGDALVSEQPEFRCWHLVYGGNQCCDVFPTRWEQDASKVKALMISRPVAEEGLWQSLYRIMQLGNVILFWPGGLSPLFATERAIPHFPADMIEALGKPVVITSAGEIPAFIQAS